MPDRTFAALASRLLPVALLFAACAGDGADAEVGAAGEPVDGAAVPVPACDPDNAGLTLPVGFCALVFAEGLGAARQLVVSASGDVYAAVRGGRGGGGHVIALRDTDGDGRADSTAVIGDIGGTGIELFDGHLYVAPDDGLVRYALPAGDLLPSGPAERIVGGLPGPGTGHPAKSSAIDGSGRVYINIGGPSNACQAQDRAAGEPGQDPCPELERRGGIWSFDARTPGQTQADGERFATGLRNTFALDLEPGTDRLYGVQHGRDGLAMSWGDLFTNEQQAEKPSEELVRIERGDDFGWPYCYHDPETDQKVLAPEYGGDGSEIGRCADAKDPELALPAHWAPMALEFYRGTRFPERYHDGAFIAFHGSWNRAPLPQEGYNVVFVEFEAGEPTGEWEVFADGFAGPQKNPGGAEHRPSGVATGPDGSLYVSDDSGGTIFRIVFTG